MDKASAAVLAPIYNPANPKHVARELDRYVRAAWEDIHTEKIISMAGPDATKVGTDFSVSMGALLNPVSKKSFDLLSAGPRGRGT